MPRIHDAYAAGLVLYVVCCPNAAGEPCSHQDAPDTLVSIHREQHYPRTAPAEFPGDQPAWERYCAQDAIYRLSAQLRDVHTAEGKLHLLAELPQGA